jgi:hypothetical protein
MVSRLSLAAGCLAACFLAAPAADPPAGFTSLFNGKDLSNWQGNTTMKERATLPPEKLAERQKAVNEKVPQFWSVEDGTIHCKGGKAGVSLQTPRDYGNFQLLVDWKIEPKGDSGIYLRGQPQVQIWDSEKLDPTKFAADLNKGSGGLWNNPPPAPGKIPLKKADKPVGEWNTFDITVVGDEVTVKLNGELVVDKGKLLNFWFKDQPAPKAGPIELQFHGDPLWFRNVYVKELP